MKSLVETLCVVFVISLFFSCSEKKDEETFQRIEKYDDGVIKERKIYKNEEEYNLDKNFQRLLYYEDGTLKEKIDYKNGKIDGNDIGYKQSGKLFFIDTYRNGNKHGIAETYDRNGEILSKILILDGKRIRWQSFSFFSEFSLYGYTVFKVLEDNITGTEVGFYLIDDEHKTMEKYGNYYVINTKSDTIMFQQKFEFEIQFLLSGQNLTNSQIRIGELDKYENFIDSASTLNYNFGSENKISIILDSTHLGNNLLLGKINVNQDTIMEGQTFHKRQEFLLYHEFYVKKWIIMPKIFNKFYFNKE